MTTGSVSQAEQRLAEPEAILEDLDEAQRRVAGSPLGPMCVLAGAGTGKTRAITHRIAYAAATGSVMPQQLLAVTFTARAAAEMRERLRALGVPGVQARTFHAAALRQLHFFWPQVVGGGLPSVQAHKAALVAQTAQRLHIQVDRAGIRDLAAEIEWAKVSMLTADAYPQAAANIGRQAPGVDHVVMARVLTEYEQVKTEWGVIDFEDVLLLLVGVLLERPDVAAQVRSQYRHFVVDEYQDVNTLQQRLLSLWLGGRSDICVVGDPAQTIYSFTGASARHLVEFPARHPGAQVVRLETNYRSTAPLVSLANVMLSSAQGETRSPIRLRSAGGSGPVPVVRTYPDDSSEAAAITADIAQRVADGAKLSQMAVLFRTNSQSEAIEAALDEAGVAYLIRGGERFWSRDEVRRAVVLLRGAALSDDGSMALPDLVADVLAGMGWTSQPPTSGGARRDEWESLAALVELGRSLAATDPSMRLRGLLADVEERIAAAHAPSVEGVTLATLHAAKGLEWDIVFMAGCSDGYLPIAMAEGEQAIEEERRLMYVGITRARKELVLTWASSRATGGRATRRRSRFLDSAGEVLTGVRADPSPPVRRASGASTKKRKAPASCRGCAALLTTAAERKLGRCSQCPPTYDEAMFERLRSWRSLVATNAKVPAFVVFTDATLIAIAEREPTNQAQLATISGVGARKLEMYASGVLAVLSGAEPADAVAGLASGATPPVASGATSSANI